MRLDALYSTIQLSGFHPVFPTFSPFRDVTRVTAYRADCMFQSARYGTVQYSTVPYRTLPYRTVQYTVRPVSYTRTAYGRFRRTVLSWLFIGPYVRAQYFYPNLLLHFCYYRKAPYGTVLWLGFEMQSQPKYRTKNYGILYFKGQAGQYPTIVAGLY